MDLHSKMTMYVTSTMTSPVTKTPKTSKWLKLSLKFYLRKRLGSFWIAIGCIGPYYNST
jgi:hypothetical protein